MVNRIVVALLVSVLHAFAAASCWAAGVVLPPTFVTQDLLAERYESSAPGAMSVAVGGCAAASNNIQSLWTIANRKQPARGIDTSSPYASAQVGQWLRISDGGWIVATGNGFRDHYAGNHDAAQLWNDLHTAVRSQVNYYPNASDLHVAAQWYGVGRDIPFRVRALEGNCEVFARYISANDLLARTLVGSVEGADFQGIVRIISATPGSSRIRGRGWSLDARTTAKLGQRWEGLFSVEGILGQVEWRNVEVQDAFVLSPRVFQDPQGFYHEAGEISGVATRKNLTLDVLRRCRVDVLRKGKRTDLIAGCVWRQGFDPSPNLGAAANQFRGWTPFARVYPTESRCELGAVGRGWLVSLSADGWLFSAPRSLALDVSVGTAW